MYLCIPIPFAALGKTEVFLAERLACLIHAANVHSEPGSNPSKIFDLKSNRNSGSLFNSGGTDGQISAAYNQLASQKVIDFYLCKSR